MTLGRSAEASLPATAPTWARLPDRVPLDRPDGADLKPSGDCSGAGVWTVRGLAGRTRLPRMARY